LRWEQGDSRVDRWLSVSLEFDCRLLGPFPRLAGGAVRGRDAPTFIA
jgi:hypothetical protein